VSLFRRLYPLTKLLKLRSLFREYENPAAYGCLLAQKERGLCCLASSVFLLYPLTKLLKLRSLFRELENPSAQNSRTVRNLAPDRHGLLQNATARK
jgi:hypothetical protein